MEELKNGLPILFDGIGEVKGHKFRQISSTDKAFLYEVIGSNGKYYKVFKKRKNARFGNVSYPKSKSFGVWAWTFQSIGMAKMKYNELNYSNGNK